MNNSAETAERRAVMKSETPQTHDAYMCRIPPVNDEKYHAVGRVNELGATDEPSRAFWTNESVKALMARQGPQPEYVSICGNVRGDWRSIQVSDAPFDGEMCNRCERGVRGKD